MSTHSIIAALIDTKIHVIYCHADSELSGVGQGLITFYNDLNQIKSLVNLGSLSFLGSKISTCCAYHRDMGQSWERVKPLVLNGFEELLEVNKDQDFIYYYDGKEWIYSQIYVDKTFRSVQKSLQSMCRAS